MPDDVVPTAEEVAAATAAQAAEQEAAQAAATAAVPPVPEWQQAINAIAQQVQGLATLIQQQRPAPAPLAPPAADAGYTDEQLYELAAAGNRDAMKLIDERRDTRLRATLHTEQATQQAVMMELQKVVGKYPALTDQAHALTQAATTYKQALIARGAPDGPATILEAIRQTILDHPELVPRSLTPAEVQETQRRTAAQQQQGVEGTTVRRPAARTGPTRQLSDKEWEIAQRMGYKTREDAIKALDRHGQRSEAGRSSVSPTVAAIVKEG